MRPFMTDNSPKQVTQLLLDCSGGDQAAVDRLIPYVYDELHRLARRYIRQERAEHTLQATALVNEAYLRLVDQRQVRWQNRAHFFGIAAQLMRRILIDYARKRGYAKRGGGAVKIALDDGVTISQQRAADLVALDDALKQLTSIDLQQSRVVELRFFGGLTIEETAEVLKVSPDTVKREWSTAKAWLYREIAASRDDGH